MQLDLIQGRDYLVFCRFFLKQTYRLNYATATKPDVCFVVMSALFGGFVQTVCCIYLTERHRGFLQLERFVEQTTVD